MFLKPFKYFKLNIQCIFNSDLQICKKNISIYIFPRPSDERAEPHPDVRAAYGQGRAQAQGQGQGQTHGQTQR